MGGYIDLQFSVRLYVPKSCVYNFSYFSSPTWHEDDRKDRILRSCKFYMSYGTLLFILLYTLAQNENFTL